MLPDQAEKTLVTIDDVCPSLIKENWQFIDDLKKRFPALKVLCFTIARFKDDNSEDISKSELFKEWFHKRKDWIEIGLHGLTHGFPPEFLRWEEYQMERLTSSMKILSEFLPEKISFRPPGFKLNSYTERACFKCNIKAIVLENLVLVYGQDINKDFTIVNLHLSNNQANSVNIINNQLDNILKNTTQIFLSEAI